MAHVNIIGTGNMGQAIASVATKGGNTVELFSRADAQTPLTGDVVVLALPYPALADVIAERSEQLVGKTIVDITNPVNFETFDSLTVPADSSATAELTKALPHSSVVKAFNTNFAGTLASGINGERPTTVLIAGDDADAKDRVSQIVTDAGLSAIDAGAESRARELESIGFLQITLAAAEKIQWTGGFNVVA